MTPYDYTRPNLPIYRSQYEDGTDFNIIKDVTNAIGLAIDSTDDLNAIKIAAKVIKNQQEQDDDLLDIRVVKFWYQGASAPDLMRPTDEKKLIPELLLRNDDLIRVDRHTQNNFAYIKRNEKYEYLNISNSSEKGVKNRIVKIKDFDINDSEKMAEFSVVAGERKYIYITIPAEKIPDTNMSWSLSIEHSGKKIYTYKLIPVVHKFELADTGKIHGVYYRALLDEKDEGSISSELKSSKQMLAELNDMKRHGVNSVGIYQPPVPREQFIKVLDMLAALGFSKQNFFSVGITTGNPLDQAENEKKVWQARQLRSLLFDRGYNNLYVYGIDEPNGEQFVAQRGIWERIKQSDINIFFASNNKEIDKYIPDQKLIFIDGFEPTVERYKYLSKGGSGILTFRNPFSAVENPETFRKNVGFLLWQSGYDGNLTYAYQDTRNFIWNDFDSDVDRDLVLAYPTATGVVDTLAWEGFREGITDWRLFVTLEHKIASSTSSRNADIAKRYISYLKKNNNLNLSEVRKNIIQYIELLN